LAAWFLSFSSLQIPVAFSSSFLQIVVRHSPSALRRKIDGEGRFRQTTRCSLPDVQTDA
jgi:hypothetical protein